MSLPSPARIVSAPSPPSTVSAPPPAADRLGSAAAANFVVRAGAADRQSGHVLQYRYVLTAGAERDEAAFAVIRAVDLPDARNVVGDRLGERANEGIHQRVDPVDMVKPERMADLMRRHGDEIRTARVETRLVRVEKDVARDGAVTRKEGQRQRIALSPVDIAEIDADVGAARAPPDIRAVIGDLNEGQVSVLLP